MKARHKRLALIGGVLAVVGIVAALVAQRLQQQPGVLLHARPQVAAGKAPQGKPSASAAWSRRQRQAQRRRRRRCASS